MNRLLNSMAVAVRADSEGSFIGLIIESGERVIQGRFFNTWLFNYDSQSYSILIFFLA